MRIVISILTCLISITSFCQSNWSIKVRQEFQLADFAFYQEDYVYALKLLSNVYEIDSTYGPLLYEYGTSLLIVEDDEVFAESLLNKAVQKKEKEAYYWYARALHKNGKHQEAVKYYNEYLDFTELEIPRNEVKRQIQISNTAVDLRKQPVDVEVRNLGPGINAKTKEYVPIITSDGNTIYFTSRRKNDLHDKLDSNNEYFEDIYKSEYINGAWAQSEALSEYINTKTHDATVAISGDGKTMIIYRTNKKLTGGDLYITERKYNQWKKPKKLNKNINSPYQEASACLSNDGKIMYFSSNRSGGYGGKDIYQVRKLPNGEWSKAMNLGSSVNSSFDEDSPFINNEGNILYFSSNGHQTMGGYDVFKSELVGEYWAKPENLGYPINTEDDELYLTLDQTETRGFYASDKSSGFGQLDIYQVEFIYRSEKEILVMTDVRNENEDFLDATITLYDQDSEKLQGIYNTHPETGKFVMVIHPRTKYTLLLEAEGHQMRITDLYIEDITEELIHVEIDTYYLRSEQ